MLCLGIQCNEFLKCLSLNYCDIDHEGARPLFELLIFSKSKLEELLLTGNALRNEGVKMILNGVSVAKELKKIYLADNQWNGDIEVLECIKNCMTKNKSLARYDFRNNELLDDAVIFFTEMLGPEEEGKISHVTEIEISERVSKDGGKKLVEENPDKYETYIKIFKDKLGENKPKKGKKGKKGGKKKKKGK
mgnify:CR=1 FL=1